MSEFKLKLGAEDIEAEWKMLCTENSSIWYKLKHNRFLPEGVYPPPEPHKLLGFLKSMYNYQYLVPSTSLFENNNGLSTQVPMHHIYYTECKDLLEWNEHLGYTEVRYFEHTWELEKLQKLIKERVG